MVINGSIEFFNPQDANYYTLNINVYENGVLSQTLDGTITGAYNYNFLPINIVVVPTSDNSSWSISLTSSGIISISAVNPITSNIDKCFFTICFSQNQ